MREPTRILLADDHALVRRGVRLILDHEPDLIVDDKVVVEVKSVEGLAPIHVAQMLTYLKVTSLRVGLILNFNSSTMRQGTRRVVLMR